MLQELCFAIQNREAHDENCVACDAIRVSLEGVNLLWHEQCCI